MYDFFPSVLHIYNMRKSDDPVYREHTIQIPPPHNIDNRLLHAQTLKVEYLVDGSMKTENCLHRDVPVKLSVSFSLSAHGIFNYR